MIEKRFWIEDNCVGYYTEIVDNDKELQDVPNPKKNLTIDEAVDLLNELNKENKMLKKQLECSKEEADDYCEELMGYDEFVRLYKRQRDDAIKENEELKQLIKKFEKEIHLIHMASMFSTVKSFKGDVSKRYKYSEETDTIYDTANKYGQYSKILDKKEVVMLLNEYETLLEGEEWLKLILFYFFMTFGIFFNAYILAYKRFD